MADAPRAANRSQVRRPALPGQLDQSVLKEIIIIIIIRTKSTRDLLLKLLPLDGSSDDRIQCWLSLIAENSPTLSASQIRDHLEAGLSELGHAFEE